MVAGREEGARQSEVTYGTGNREGEIMKREKV